MREGEGEGVREGDTGRGSMRERDGKGVKKRRGGEVRKKDFWSRSCIFFKKIVL